MARKNAETNVSKTETFNEIFVLNPATTVIDLADAISERLVKKGAA